MPHATSTRRIYPHAFERHIPRSEAGNHPPWFIDVVVVVVVAAVQPLPNGAAGAATDAAATDAASVVRSATSTHSVQTLT